jgi:hypothetical protein
LYYTLLRPPLRPLVLKPVEGRLGRDAVCIGVHGGKDSARSNPAQPGIGPMNICRQPGSSPRMDSKAGRPGSGGRGDAGAGGDRGGDAKRAAALAPSGTGAREARARPAGEVPDPAVPELACSELTAGLDLRKRGRLALAMSCFERAAAAAPQLADAWFWLAVTRDNLGLEAEAIAAYRRALQCGLPDVNQHAQALMWLASSLSKTGEHDGALTALARARELGGYEPPGEYQRLRRAIWRRSAAPRRTARERPPPEE